MDASTSRGKNKIIWSTKEGLAAFGWPSEAMFQRELWIIPLSRYWAVQCPTMISSFCGSFGKLRDKASHI